jgi:hypothetical protein
MTGYHPRSTAQRHRVDLALAVLYESGFPLTTAKVADRMGVSYSTAYSLLRALCGSNSNRWYAENVGKVNAPGYPVIWHSWTDPDRGAYVSWSLTEEERHERDSLVAQLEARFQVPS